MNPAYEEEQRRDTVFNQRDMMLETLHEGRYRMGPTAYILLWFLLFNMRKPDPTDEWAYHVNIYKTRMAVLCDATGREETAIRRGLKELEDNGFIELTPRIRTDGSTTNPDIKMTSPLRNV
jgi:hypothetical protein